MASAVFTVEQEKIINENPDSDIFVFFRRRLQKENISSAALSEDAMSRLKGLLRELFDTDAARSITLPGSLDSLSIRLSNFIKWVEQETLPTTLTPHCSSLLEKVASGASDLDIWTTIVTLLEEFDRLMMTPTNDSVGDSVGTTPISSDMVKKDWTSTFIPDSLDVLKDVISDFDNPNAKIGDFYARTLIFIQSSGMGKSRLADAFGQSCPMINYVLREEGTRGYPPADDKILSFMRKDPSAEQKRILTNSPTNTPKKTLSQEYPKSRMDATWYHSLAVGLLQASFETLNAWIGKHSTPMSREKLAARIHEAMAYNSGSEESPDHQPRQRIEFCQSVFDRAERIASDLIQKQSWRQVFDNEEHSAIRHQLIEKKANHLKGLLEAVRKLLDKLEEFQPSNDRHPPPPPPPPLVVVIDEASSLLITKKSTEIHSGRYIALNRIMSCLKEYKIWFFIISTESQVGTILPSDNAKRDGNYVEDPSLRYIDDDAKQQLKRIPPFLAFRLDIQDRCTVQQSEHSRSLSDFGKPNHMAMFGRRLWFAYAEDPKMMNRIAKQKLIGGRPEGTYDAKNEDHVFAALSFRLSLDPCLNNSKALPLIRTSVNSHMRVVISIDEETDTMYTITPSEPVLAKAAMEHLCIEQNWATSINTLVRNLFEKGLVEKGLKGELYARLLLVLAQDWVQLRQEDESNREPHQELKSISSRAPNPEFSPEFMKPFTVKDFLEALYDKSHHESIKAVDSQILEARMNFTHFVPTAENLYPEVLPDLLHDLLRRSAALQLAPCQPTYDILLPIYFGEENEPLDPSKCGCVMIQVKNKGDATTPRAIFREKFTTAGTRKNQKAKKQKASDAPTKHKKAKIRNGPYFVLDEMTNPILFLLFDLGIIRAEKATAPLFEVSRSSNSKSPRVWAIHSRGNDNKVFGCLERMSCAGPCKTFFDSTTLGDNAHDNLARQNELFSELRRDFRYPPVEDEEDVSVEDKDVPMEDEDVSVEDEEDVPMEDEQDVPVENENVPVEDKNNLPLSKRLRPRR